MIDMRKHIEIIKKTVNDQNRDDKDWKWYVKGVTKNEAKLGWGYLDYIGEKRCFSVYGGSITEDTIVVIGDLISDSVCCFVGPSRFDDFGTVEDGIASVIYNLAETARNIY